MPIKLQYVKGDATAPFGTGNRIITHICNDDRRWGSGFVLAISRKWKKPKSFYLNRQDQELGTVGFVQVENTIWVANMIAQHGVKSARNPTPIKYRALTESLRIVAFEARKLGASIHMPRIGSGRAGGDWDIIELIIKESLDGFGVTVYDL